VKLLSVQVGQPAQLPVPGTDGLEQFLSAIGKTHMPGSLRLGTLGLTGDDVADHRFHGGPEQAVLVYPMIHYAEWRLEWQRTDVGAGGFGENFTIDGATEDTVCIGDRWQIGEVVTEVSKPRTPCNKLQWRQRRDDLIRRVQETGRSGWYLRILEEGEVCDGMAIERIAHPCPEWSVRRTAFVMANRQAHPADAAALGQCPFLAEDWRYRLAREGWAPSP
jgi:MOSC domain-containing protein YiiM